MALTEEAFMSGKKDVTRRLGWEFAKPGEQLLVVNRVMGISDERPVRKLGVVEILSVRREPLNWITQAEVVREGFAFWSPKSFVEFFCKNHRDCGPSTEITRIEFKVLKFLARGRVRKARA